MIEKELEAKLHHEIPLSKAMGIRVLSIDTDRAVLFAPLGPNTNHKSTAFGGSVHSVAVLACWSLLTHFLEGSDVDYVVVQRSEIDYKMPITADFSASARWASADAFEKFKKTLAKKGLARVAVNAKVLCENLECADLKAEFVAAVRK